jgi:hypothetical protein
MERGEGAFGEICIPIVEGQQDWPFRQRSNAAPPGDPGAGRYARVATIAEQTHESLEAPRLDRERGICARAERTDMVEEQCGGPAAMHGRQAA